MTTTRPARLRRTATTLADGRELIYFDDTEPWLSGAQSRDAVDHRPLGERAAAGEMRLDALTGDWVAIAGHRLNRTFLPPADECPLCPTGRGTVPSEIPAADYDVVVFENRFPSFSAVAGAPDPSGEPLLAERARARAVRGRLLHQRPRGGVRLPHPRRGRAPSSTRGPTARPSCPRSPRSSRSSASRTAGRRSGSPCTTRTGRSTPTRTSPPAPGSCWRRPARTTSAPAGCSAPTSWSPSARDGSRVVLSGRHWTAYVPYAARWPVEVHLAPHRDVPDLVALEDEERDELAEVYLDLLAPPRPLLRRRRR